MVEGSLTFMGLQVQIRIRFNKFYTNKNLTQPPLAKSALDFHKATLVLHFTPSMFSTLLICIKRGPRIKIKENKQIPHVFEICCGQSAECMSSITKRTKMNCKVRVVICSRN